jgi:hypothetical protein
MVDSGLRSKSLAQVGHKQYNAQTTAHNENEMELAPAEEHFSHTDYGSMVFIVLYNL